MRSMQWQLGMLGTVSAFAFRHRETEKNLCRGGRSQWPRYDHKRMSVFMHCALYSCPIIMSLEFSRRVFEKFSNIKFHENLSSERRVVPCALIDGQTDTPDEANSCFFAILRTRLIKFAVMEEQSYTSEPHRACNWITLPNKIKHGIYARPYSYKKCRRRSTNDKDLRSFVPYVSRMLRPGMWYIPCSAMGECRNFADTQLQNYTASRLP